MKKPLTKRLQIAWLKRRARALMRPWIVRRDEADCGHELLKTICGTAWQSYRRGCALARLAMRMEKTLLVLAACLLTAACEPKPPAWHNTPGAPPPWLHIQQESYSDYPDSPEQVLITLRTNDGKKWVATWEETK